MIDAKRDLPEETIDKLQQLIRVNIDSQRGFDQAAETIKDDGIAVLFREIAQDRATNAAELQRYVALNAEAPEAGGSAAGAMRRWWLGARGALNGGDDYVVLIEAERGEDSIKHSYEEVLEDSLGSPMSDVLTRQYAKVKSQHDRIRDMRNARAKR